MRKALLGALLATAGFGAYGLGGPVAPRPRTYSSYRLAGKARKAEKARRRAVKKARTIQRKAAR